MTQPTSRKSAIEQHISGALNPTFLQVLDESHKHSSGKGAESHFNVTVVSALFAGELRVKRHRRIHKLLAAELQAGMHALTLSLMTPEEYEERGRGLDSPLCHSKKTH